MEVGEIATDGFIAVMFFSLQSRQVYNLRFVAYFTQRKPYARKFVLGCCFYCAFVFCLCLIDWVLIASFEKRFMYREIKGRGSVATSVTVLMFVGLSVKPVHTASGLCSFCHNGARSLLWVDGGAVGADGVSVSSSLACTDYRSADGPAASVASVWTNCTRQNTPDVCQY